MGFVFVGAHLSPFPQNLNVGRLAGEALYGELPLKQKEGALGKIGCSPHYRLLPLLPYYSTAHDAMSGSQKAPLNYSNPAAASA